MYLVYLTSYLDINSVKQWLYIKGKSDALIIDDVNDLMNELLIDTYDIIVFDYKMDIALIDTLRTLEGRYSSIQVFVSNSKIGEAYLPVTENISILPKTLNLMVYLWEHPAFTLGNMLNAEDAGKEVFSVSDFADIDTEREVLEFKTTIEDLGDSDLAEVEMLKVEKQALLQSITPVVSYAEEEEEDPAYEVEDILASLGLEPQSLGGLLRREREVIALDTALTEIVSSVEEKEKEFKLKQILDEVPPREETTEEFVAETTEEFVAETTAETVEETVAETTEETVEETTKETVEETTEEIVEETIEEVTEETTEEIVEETIEEVTEETTEEIVEEVTEETTELVPEFKEDSVTIDESDEDTTTSKTPEDVEMEESNVNSSIQSGDIEDVKSPDDDNKTNRSTVTIFSKTNDYDHLCTSLEDAVNFIESMRSAEEPKVETIYEEYDESKKDSYDEIVVEEKSITKDTTIEAEYDNDMKDILKHTNETGIIGKSDLGEAAIVYTVKPDDLKLFEEGSKNTSKESETLKEKIKDKETPPKRESKVLKGSETYTEPATTYTKRVGIKTVEKSEDVTPVKRGTFAGLRKRSIKTYRNSYEYFNSKNLGIEELDDVNNYVSTENLKGNSILLEDELYSRGIIDDDTYILFMKEFLHRQVYSLSDLMRSDVILDTWDEDTCRKLRILELPASQSDSKRIVMGHKARAIQNSLFSKYEKLELYVTLDKYIDMRFNN